MHASRTMHATIRAEGVKEWQEVLQQFVSSTISLGPPCICLVTHTQTYPAIGGSGERGARRAPALLSEAFVTKERLVLTYRAADGTANA